MKISRTRDSATGRARASAAPRPKKRLTISNAAPLERSVMSAQVSKVIVTGLLDGHLRPGDRLVENDPREPPGRQPSPIREALTELAQSGVIVREPGRGGRIREWTRKDLEELFGVRSILEGYATRLVVPRFDERMRKDFERIIARMRSAGRREDFLGMIELDLQFHELLWRIAGNALLERVLQGLSQQFRLFLTMNWKFHGGLNEVADNQSACSRRSRAARSRGGRPGHAGPRRRRADEVRRPGRRLGPPRAGAGGRGSRHPPVALDRRLVELDPRPGPSGTATWPPSTRIGLSEQVGPQRIARRVDLQIGRALQRRQHMRGRGDQDVGRPAMRDDGHTRTSARAAMRSVSVMPPQRAMSGCTMRRPPRSIRSRKPNRVVSFSPVAIGVRDRAVSRAKPSRSSGASGSSRKPTP